MGIVNVVVGVLGMKPVQNLLSALTGKLLGSKNAINPKVVATMGVAAWVALGIAIAASFDPGLGELLRGSEASLVSVVGLIAAIVAYYTPNNTASP